MSEKTLLRKDNIVVYDERIEMALKAIEENLKTNYNFSKRAIALLLLQGDEEITRHVKNREKTYDKIEEIIAKTKNLYKDPLQYVITLKRQEKANEIVRDVSMNTSGEKNFSFSDLLDKITMQPLTGVPILILILYFGLYKFVGQFGAGTLVDFIEGNIFETYINPLINNLVATYVPVKSIQELLAFDYGIITLGIRYAVAIILPIVGTFFFVFSIIEDTGYLPRLAMLIDRVFKSIGLSGRAVIPMTLGFGCDTMATLVSRTLETKRERVIATLLLALAIPCSAQLGVILSLLSQKPLGLIIWMGFVSLIFLIVGYLSAQVLPGEKPHFYMELPPLRMPKLSNIIEKTVSRMQWYFLEIVPLFVLASVLIWFGKITGLFDSLIKLLSPVMNLLGLPTQTAEAFLFGFFRRDYGAAGLYDLQKSGILNGPQLVVASVTLTLFVPCIAQFSIMIKERGFKTAMAIVGFIIPFAFLSGFTLNLIFRLLGVNF